MLLWRRIRSTGALHSYLLPWIHSHTTGTWLHLSRRSQIYWKGRSSKVRHSKKGCSNLGAIEIAVKSLVTCPAKSYFRIHLAWRHRFLPRLFAEQQFTTGRLQPLRTKYAIFRLNAWVRIVVCTQQIIEQTQGNEIVSYLGSFANFCWIESYSHAFGTTHWDWGRNCCSSKWPSPVGQSFPFAASPPASLKSETACLCSSHLLLRRLLC